MKIIAEIGFSHAGRLDLAKQLIEAAADAGASAVKTQIRDVASCYGPTKLAEPKDSPWGDTYEEYAYGRELPTRMHTIIKEYCHKLGLEYGFSLWDSVGADASIRIEPDFVKIPSAKLRDLYLIKKVGKSYSCPMYISTGASDMADVDNAVLALRSVRRQASLTLFHCCMSYPTDNDNANLEVLKSLYYRFPLAHIGYSDHTRGIVSAVAAYSRYPWLKAVEKHFTLDRAGQPWNPDAAASLEPEGLWRMVRDLRAVECMFGDGTKRVLDCERKDYERLVNSKW